MLELKIALCGTLRSGKDTVAEMIGKDGFSKFAFAEGIWATIELLFPEVYERKFEEKPRKLLQDIGQKMREVDPDVWIRYTFKRIEQSGAKRVLVTDLRQPNELEALKAAGFFIVRVNADPEIRIARAKAAGDNFNIQDMLHETERHVERFHVDFDIENNGTIEELGEKVNHMFSEILRRKGARGN
jgi:dephospho-CoA kinase